MDNKDSRSVVAMLVLVAISLYLSPFIDGLGRVRPAAASPQDGNHDGTDPGDDGPSVITATSGASPACDVPGLEFSLEVCNDGSTPLQEVVVTDTLPVGMVFSEGTIAAFDEDGNPVGAGLCGAGTGTAVDECPCEGGVTFLRLRYNGPNGADVTVEAKDFVIFGGFLDDGDTLDLYGSRPDGRFRKNNLIFTVNNEDTVIHVSCSKPIGVDSIFGPFTVEAFASRNGGLFDGVCEPPPPACPCKGGVTSLTLSFNGNVDTQVMVEDDRTVIFDQVLNDNDEFVLDGTRPDGRFQKNNLVLTAGDQDTVIHVSCSKPIGIGSVFGPFTVVAFSSRDGGTFAAPCDGSEAGTSSKGKHGGDQRDPCKGQKIKICLDAPIHPGECVTISYVATFENALCRRVDVQGRSGDTAAAGETVKVKTSTEDCLDDLLNEMLACMCDPSGGGGGFDIWAFCGLTQDECDIDVINQCVEDFADFLLYAPDGPIGLFWEEKCAACCLEPASDWCSWYCWE